MKAIFVNMRPYLNEFIETVTSHFEVIFYAHEEDVRAVFPDDTVLERRDRPDRSREKIRVSAL